MIRWGLGDVHGGHRMERPCTLEELLGVPLSFLCFMSSSALTVTVLTLFVGGEQREKRDGRVTNTRIRFAGRSKLFPGVLFPYVTWRGLQLFGQSDTMKLNIGESALLAQPPSFSKKKNYEFHEVLGRGTFGKVIVCMHSSPSTSSVLF